MILPFQKLHSHWLSGQPTTTTRQKEQSSPVFIGLSLTLISTHLLPTDSVPCPSVPVEVYRQSGENQIKKTSSPRLFLPRRGRRLTLDCHESPREVHPFGRGRVAGRDVQDFSKIRERNSLRSRRGRRPLWRRTGTFRWREVSAVLARGPLGYLGGMDALDT